MNTTALVINFNAAELLSACIQSLVNSSATDILVVDNNSEDTSFSDARKAFGEMERVRFQENPVNLGFGPAINECLHDIQTDLLLVINPDCQLDQGALELMESALVADKQAAMAGPLVRRSNGEVEAASLRRFPTPWRSLMSFSGLARWLGSRWPLFSGVAIAEPESSPAIREAEATSGACMLMRVSDVRALGGFDESYRLHCEDLDLMYRLGEEGRKILFVPDARATHVQGVSSSTRPFWVHREKHRGMARFFNEHLAAETFLPVRWLVRLGIFLRWLLLWPVVWLRR